MTLSQFRRAVFDSLGPNMEHATPANVREFLDGIQQRLHEESAGHNGPRGPLRLNEHAVSWEQILREFFSEVLKMPDDAAIITLWTMAVEMSFQALEGHYAEIFRPLFPDAFPE